MTETPVAYCTVSMDAGTAQTKGRTEEAQFLGHALTGPYSQVWFKDWPEPQFVHRTRILEIRWAK
jgi:hypothetical protein